LQHTHIIHNCSNMQNYNNMNMFINYVSYTHNDKHTEEAQNEKTK